MGIFGAVQIVKERRVSEKEAFLRNKDSIFPLVGCFGFNGPLRQYFTLYRAVSQREGERRKKG